MSLPLPLPLPLSLSVLLTFSFFTTSLSLSSLSPHLPDRFFKTIPQSLRQNTSQKYIELALPLPSDRLIPSCSLRVFNHTFGDTIGRPPTSVSYTPPSDCPPPWSYVVLELLASSKGDQYDRIAAVWLAGAEILRTSTAEPTADGVFWKVRTDVTRYAFLLKQSNLTLTVMLENVVTKELTGVYNVRLNLFYYKGKSVRVPSHHHKLSRKSGLLGKNRVVDLVNKESQLRLESEKFSNSPLTGNINSDSLNFYNTPADLIIPISSVGDKGFWFIIESHLGVKSKGVRIPLNTHKAVLEIYVSFHGNDEFWYSNPPDSYISMNNLTTGRGHGAYREVFVTIDGSFIGSIIPFPVIFTGGINPLFWEPVVAIGAFNLPSYNFDLTPFLGFLLDGKVHFIGLGVADSIPFWLVDANLHLWLDHGSLTVEAKTVTSHAPTLSIKRNSRFKQLDGSFKIEAKRKNRFSGWVKSSAGNLTTHVLNQFKYKNLITFRQNGTYKSVNQIVKTLSEVRVESETGNLISRAVVKRKYPLRMITSTLSGSETDSYLMVTNVSHSVREKSRFGDLSSSLHNSQDSRGWMVVEDHNVLSGSATTGQRLSSKDEFGCYSRSVSATDGRLIRDNTTFSCLSTS